MACLSFHPPCLVLEAMACLKIWLDHLARLLHKVRGSSVVSIVQYLVNMSLAQQLVGPAAAQHQSALLAGKQLQRFSHERRHQPLLCCRLDRVAELQLYASAQTPKGDHTKSAAPPSAPPSR